MVVSLVTGAAAVLDCAKKPLGLLVTEVHSLSTFDSITLESKNQSFSPTALKSELTDVVTPAGFPNDLATCDVAKSPTKEPADLLFSPDDQRTPIRCRKEDTITIHSDKYQCRYVALDNGFRAMLIHDHSCALSTVEARVSVGLANDPKEFPGLSHLVQHTLLLGTKRYPKLGEFCKFFIQNAGQLSSKIGSNETRIHFSIDPSHLEESLDRLADVLINPEFSEEQIDRAVEVVQSEPTVKSSVNRRSEIQSHLVDAAHPVNRGNDLTLRESLKAKGLNIRNQLIKFHEENYIAPKMTLCIVSQKPLDQLEQMIRNGDLTKIKTGVPSPKALPLHRPEDLGRFVGFFIKPLLQNSFLFVQVKVVSPRDRQLVFDWFIPNNDNPHLISRIVNLFRLDCSGSLLNVLRQENLVKHVIKDKHSRMISKNQVSVPFRLTKYGATPKGLSRISHLVYSYIM